MPLHPRTPSFLASFKSRLVLPFWYRLTQVVLEKRPLSGCSSTSNSSSSSIVTFPFAQVFYDHSTLNEFVHGDLVLWYYPTVHVQRVRSTWRSFIRLQVLLLPYLSASLYPSIPRYQNSFHHRHFHCSLQARLLQLSLSQPAQVSDHPAPTDPELSCTCAVFKAPKSSHITPILRSLDWWT